MDANITNRMKSFEKFYQIIRKLREPDGCPWDLKQTAETLRKDLLEEVYECIEAIDKNDNDNLKEELGDIFLLVTMIIRIKEQDLKFNIEEVLESISAKLIRRHPHVFGDEKVASIDEIKENWDKIKRDVEGKRTIDSILEKIPSAVSPLNKAHTIQKRVAKVGFEWDSIEPVFQKLEEEIVELKVELSKNDFQRIEEELGDVLFTVVNLARMLKIDSDLALNRANSKFINRFQGIEQRLKEQNIKVEDAGINLLDNLWEEIKKNESSKA